MGSASRGPRTSSARKPARSKRPVAGWGWQRVDPERHRPRRGPGRPGPRGSPMSAAPDAWPKRTGKSAVGTATLPAGGPRTMDAWELDNVDATRQAAGRAYHEFVSVPDLSG